MGLSLIMSILAVYNDMSGRLQIFSCVLYSELDDVTGPTQVPVTFTFHSFVSFVFFGH